MNNTQTYPAPLAGQQATDAEIVLGAVLYQGARTNPAAGSGSRVKWNASNTTCLGVVRPSYIGLGHELIHALHNQLGDQPGVDNGGTSTVLYEYICVGLGPFANPAAFPHTENALRAGAGVPVRDRYAN